MKTGFTLKLFIALLIILVAFPVVVFNSCNTTANNEVNYIIKKGNHYCVGNNINIKPTLKAMNFTVTFKENCKYNLNTKDSSDINKVFGFSIGYHHKSSARLGWNYKAAGLKLYNYSYFNGVVKAKAFKPVYKLEKPIYCSVYFTGDSSIMTVTQDTNTIILALGGIKTYSTYSYILYPYFGGTSVAPHDMNIIISNLNYY